MKDNILRKLHCWVHHFRMLNPFCENPAFLPLTKEEIEIIRGVHPPGKIGFRMGDWGDSRIFGIPVRETAHAVCMRQRQIQMPITRLEECLATPLRDCIEITEYRDRLTDRLYRNMIAHVCTDTTNLLVRMEWDCFAKLKRALRITKWFPVKYRTVAIAGTVLYPYLNVTLPHNAHHVRFAVSPV